MKAKIGEQMMENDILKKMEEWKAQRKRLDTSAVTASNLHQFRIAFISRLYPTDRIRDETNVTLEMSGGGSQNDLLNCLKDGAHTNYLRMLRSNGFMVGSPVLRTVEIRDDEILRRSGAFRMSLKKVSDRLNLYVRGRKLSFRWSSELEAFLSEITETDDVHIGTFIRKY